MIDKRLGGLEANLLGYFAKVTLASALTGVVVLVSWNSLHMDSELFKLMMLGTGGFIFYEIVCLGLKIEQATKVWMWVKSGFKR